jgi:hypothetical protein
MPSAGPSSLVSVVDRPIFFLDHVTRLLVCPKQENSSFMSDASYEPSSDSPGTSWYLSQQHQEVYNERKRERHAERQYQDTQKKRQKLGSPLIKQESFSPCPPIYLGLSSVGRVVAVHSAGSRVASTAMDLPTELSPR